MCPDCMRASALFVPETCCVNPEIRMKAGEVVEKAAQATVGQAWWGRVEAQSLWTMRGVMKKSITSFFSPPSFSRPSSSKRCVRILNHRIHGVCVCVLKQEKECFHIAKKVIKWEAISVITQRN